MTPMWMNMYAPEQAAHVAAQDAQGWLIGTSGDVYYYDDVLATWVQIGVPATLSSVTASTDGSVVGVGGSGNLYLYSSGSWSSLYYSSYATWSATIGDINNIGIVDATQAVTCVSNSISSSLPTGPVKISADAGLSQMWGVGSSGTVYRWNSTTSSWNTVTGKTLAQVHVSVSSSSTTQVVGVDTTGKGWSYDTSTSRWTAIPVPNPGNHFAWLEAGAGYIWGLLSTGDVYRGFI